MLGDALNLLLFLTIPATALLFFGMIIYYRLKQNQARHRRWDKAAQTLGLEHDFKPTAFGQRPGPMTGTRDGFHVCVHTFTRGSGKSARSFTSIEVTPASSLDLGLNITPERFLTRVDKALGTQDIQIGDKTFDDTFLIQGNDPNQVRAVLTPTARQQLLALHKRKPTLKVNDGGTYQEWQGIITNAKRLDVLINEHIALVSQITQAQSTHIMSQQHAKALA